MKTDASRKKPVQERSQRRYAAILDAAAAAFAEFGFEATTMEGIAATANTSIGSVYQFFPNKRAVFREVALGAVQNTGKVFAEVMRIDPSTRPWTEVLDAFFDAYRELNRTDPMMRATTRNFELYREFEAEDLAQLEQFTHVVGHLIGGWAPSLVEPQRSVVARVVVFTFATSMLVVAREEEAMAAAMLEETKVMLRQYLVRYVDAAD